MLDELVASQQSCVVLVEVLFEQPVDLVVEVCTHGVYVWLIVLGYFNHNNTLMVAPLRGRLAYLPVRNVVLTWVGALRTSVAGRYVEKITFPTPCTRSARVLLDFFILVPIL